MAAFRRRASSSSDIEVGLATDFMKMRSERRVRMQQQEDIAQNHRLQRCVFGLSVILCFVLLVGTFKYELVKKDIPTAGYVILLPYVVGMLVFHLMTMFSRGYLANRDSRERARVRIISCIGSLVVGLGFMLYGAIKDENNRLPFITSFLVYVTILLQYCHEYWALLPPAAQPVAVEPQEEAAAEAEELPLDPFRFGRRRHVELRRERQAAEKAFNEEMELVEQKYNGRMYWSWSVRLAVTVTFQSAVSFGLAVNNYDGWNEAWELICMPFLFFTIFNVVLLSVGWGNFVRSTAATNNVTRLWHVFSVLFLVAGMTVMIVGSIADTPNRVAYIASFFVHVPVLYEYMEKLFNLV